VGGGGSQTHGGGGVESVHGCEGQCPRGGGCESILDGQGFKQSIACQQGYGLEVIFESRLHCHTHPCHLKCMIFTSHIPAMMAATSLECAFKGGVDQTRYGACKARLCVSADSC
jgi:hypothetical protein